MKNQNKILMSLLTASVSALAAAPALAQDIKDKDQTNAVENTAGDYIDFKYVVNNLQLTEDQVLVKNDIKAQVEAMLTKKAPIMKIAENINIVVESYAKNDETIQRQVFEELNLGVTYGTTIPERRNDSTTLTINAAGKNTQSGRSQTSAPHAYCHTACHGACHGSRGWR
jgi:hypothetical protein